MICVFVFTMKWEAHQGKEFSLYPPMLSSKKVVQALEAATNV